jgi:hypothetical protein
MEYPNTGMLMPSTVRKSEKSPDFWGELKLDRAYLKDLINNIDGDVIPVKLSAWKRESKAGNRFLSLAVDTYKKEGVAPKKEEKDEWDI